MNKTRALLWTVRGLGLASLIVFVLVKGHNSRLLRIACPQEDWLRYGDNYGQTQVANFKILLPEEKGSTLVRTPSAEAASYRVFVMGDSFMPFHRGHVSYVQDLSERLGEPIYFEGWDIPSPTCLFRRLREPVDKSRRRLVIIERIEYLLLEQFSRVKECPGWTVEEHRATRSPLAFASRLFEIAFEDNEQAFRAFFSYGRLTRPISEALFTLRFSLFGTISDQNKVYSLNPPFVFTKHETDPDLASSFYHRHDDALIERIADNIADMRAALKAEANAELVFMPIPNKYTIHHTLLNDDPYDGFLPRLYDAVEKKGVRTVRLYESFVAEPGFLYYPTDTHWNPRGIEIALDETMKVLKRIPWR